MKEHGYFYLHKKLNPNAYKTKEELLDAAKKLDDEYRKYKVFLKGGEVKLMDDFHIDEFNEKWNETRAVCESDEACAVSIYQMITRNDLSRSIYKKYFDILEDKCNMLGLNFPSIAQKAIETEEDKYNAYSVYRNMSDKSTAKNIVDRFEEIWDAGAQSVDIEKDGMDSVAAVVYVVINFKIEKNPWFNDMLKEKCESLDIDLDKVVKNKVFKKKK